MIRQFLMAGSVLALLSGPSFAQDAAAPTAEATQAAVDEALKTFTGDSVVATADGHEIKLGDLALAFSGLNPQLSALSPDEVYAGLKDQIVTETLLAAAADKAKLGDEPETKRRLEAVRRATLAETYIAREIDNRLTDEAVKAEYDKEIGAAPVQEEVRASHILVETEEEAKAVVERLAKEDFAEVAKAESTDKGSGAEGGDLGWFTAEVMVPEFSEAAFKLEKGATSAPVKSQFGWHVIRLDDRREVEKPSLEQVGGFIRQRLAQKFAGEIIEELRGAAEVKDAEPQPPAAILRAQELFQK
ncbi:peptidylprolyl isomerase [Neomegalonema perideroedes]|uniref:peptidylprolyl isomerase n=1 Tax=Neomegalonema perideroedes TaxID=217219 RepID=UPI000477EF2B|nr:peptidylprolyl isomerase [Neomegalonema perideroedes]